MSSDFCFVNLHLCFSMFSMNIVCINAFFIYMCSYALRMIETGYWRLQALGNAEPCSSCFWDKQMTNISKCLLGNLYREK